MAKSSCAKSLSGISDFFTFAVLRLNFNKHRPQSYSREIRHRKAAFFLSLFAISVNNFRVNKLDRPVYFYNDNSSQNSNLRSCKANALGFFHCFKHIVDEQTELFVKFFNGSAFFIKELIALEQNISYCQI